MNQLSPKRIEETHAALTACLSNLGQTIDQLFAPLLGNPRSIQVLGMTVDLNDGEEYINVILDPATRTGHHIIKLPGDNDPAPHGAQLEWAQSIGGDLPNRPEMALLFAYFKERFQEAYYWTNEFYKGDSSYAWSQYFHDGDQYYTNVRSKFRAVAVRRSSFSY